MLRVHGASVTSPRRHAKYLPATIDDLSKFVLVGNDKLQAVRAEISAMKNLNLARDVREQKLAEGQEIGKLVLLAEARLGELFNQMPKSSGGDRRSEDFKIRPATKFDNDETPKPKLETARDMGFSKDQVSQFQKLADNPDAVQKAIETAQEHGGHGRHNGNYEEEKENGKRRNKSRRRSDRRRKEKEKRESGLQSSCVQSISGNETEKRQ